MMTSSQRKQFLEKIRRGTIDSTSDVRDDVHGCPLKNIELRHHQLQAVQKMMILEKKEDISNTGDGHGDICDTNYGILCDKVGSGKSIMVLALLLLKPLSHGTYETYVVDYSYCYDIGYRVVTKRIGFYFPCNIIVVPHTLCAQWSRYVTEYTNFSFMCIKTQHDVMKYKEVMDKSDDVIVILSNKVYNSFADEFRDKTFSRVIFDEADTVDIPSTKRIRAGFYWFVSASVTNIVYGRRRNLGFILDVLRMNQSIHNDFLYVKNSDEYVDLSMQLPVPCVSVIKCKVHRILKIIGNIIPARIQLMISGGDIGGAISELNIFNDTSDNIIQIVTESFRRQLNNEKTKLEMNAQLIFPTELEKERALTECQKNIKTLESKIEFIRNRIEEEDVDPITFDMIENPVITKCCQNKFEAKSILDYIRFKSQTSNVFCPMCKAQPFSMDSFIYMVDKKMVKEDHISKNSSGEWISIEHNKIENLTRLFMTGKIKPTEKILIMTQYNNCFGAELKNMLDDMKIKWKSLQTPGMKLLTIVDQYQKGDLNCLILNTNYYGAGINLEMTDHVVFLHKMPSEVEMQGVGRAQRIGRKGVLQIWKLLDIYECES